MRWIVRSLVLAAVIGIVGFAAFKLSPWPTVLLIRYTFDKDAEHRNRALEKFRPSGIVERHGIPYGTDPRERMNVFSPPRDQKEPGAVVIWIHGGAFVAGQPEDLSGYLRILAGHGHTIVALGYPLAPAAQYPAPIRSINEALRYLSRNAASLGLDHANWVLAGDSAGAQIAAQVAAALAEPGYAQAIGIDPALPPGTLKGVVLFCGIFDAGDIKTEGAFGGFIRTVLWSYFGSDRLGQDPRFRQFSVREHITRQFPPALISVGNGDPLAPQSVMLAEAIRNAGASVETLFFPPDHQPRLGHEYQFDLDQPAGQQALERLLAFLATHRSAR